jgi:hypothetical protein
MSRAVAPIDDQSRKWQEEWDKVHAKSWRIANDGKYYPRKPAQVERKDIDDVIATVR